jgi:hypothetical protein
MRTVTKYKYNNTRVQYLTRCEEVRVQSFVVTVDANERMATMRDVEMRATKTSILEARKGVWMGARARVREQC